MTTNPTKIAVMVKLPAPKNVKELQSFLDLIGYYRKFVANYVSIALPLTQLFKKGNFQWNETTKNSFQKLKSAMMSVPVLGILDFTEAFVLETGINIHWLFSVKLCPLPIGLKLFMYINL